MSDADALDAALDRLEEDHASRIRSFQPQFEALISQATGWQGVGDLAGFMVETLIANQGRSPIRPVRSPCTPQHAPFSMDEQLVHLMATFHTTAGDPAVQEALREHRRYLTARFGLG
jgi:hypothetical protein